MPIAETFACNKIAIDYTMPDGQVESIETKVMGRMEGQQVFEDKVAAG